MKIGYSAQQIRDAERPHLDSGEPLMARAAAALAQAVRGLLGATGAPEGARVLLLVGSGNNGGDALFAGAALATAGCEVLVLEVGSRTHPDGLAAALQAGARRIDSDVEPEELAALARSVHVVVDGILGIGGGGRGLRGRARAVVAELLKVIHDPGAPKVVAVDLPSGIGPDDGRVTDEMILPADVTVTFGGYKAGLLTGPAVRLAGDVRLIDIGIGADLAQMTPLVRVP